MNNPNQIVVENRNRGYLTFFIGLWLAVWAVFTLTMIYALLFDNNGRYSFLFTILAVLGIVGIIVWRQFLWNIRGKYILTFEEKHLVVESAGSISLAPKNIIRYENFIEFIVIPSYKPSFIGKLWGVGGEIIKGKCLIKDFYIGSGWRQNDAEIIVDELNKRLIPNIG